MWRGSILLFTLLATLVGYADSSCELISLPKCACQYPTAKRYEIDCQYSGLSSVPSKRNHTLQEGDVSGNFSHNTITSIPDYYFLFMKHFDILDFSSNRITKLNKNTFAGLETRLTNLDMSKNQIGSVPQLALKDFIRLNNLDLSGNKITSPCFIHTADVITLSYAGNGIANLKDQCFGDSTRVESLDLSDNRIITVGPEAFEGMQSLKSLDLGFNKLTNLDKGLESLIPLSNFEYLSLRGNRLQYLRSLCKVVLNRISVIDVSYNELKDIQKYCFQAYSSISPKSATLTLNFEHNRLTSLAGAAFAGLNDKLTHLLLNHNMIADINVNTFKDLEKLVILNLNNNQISSLEFLRNWDENVLEELSIANNLIESLSPGVFNLMIRLTKLSLDGNLLVNIESSAFHGMTILNDLSVEYNLLTNIADKAFNGLDMLKKLSLTGNALVTLKNCSFSNLDRLVQFHFEDNLLLCDCDLLWLLEFAADIKGRGIRDASIIAPVLEDYCHYPKSVDGRYMANVVSENCQTLNTNDCFGLHVKHSGLVDGTLNVTWSWNVQAAASSVKLVYLSQTEVETGTIVYNASVTTIQQPITLPVVQQEQIYKVGIYYKTCFIYLLSHKTTYSNKTK